MGVENYIFWPETGSGFEEPGGTTQQKFPGEPSRSPYPVKRIHSDSFSFLCVPYTWF